MTRPPRPAPEGREALRRRARAALAALTPPQRQAFLQTLCDELPHMVLKILDRSGHRGPPPE